MNEISGEGKKKNMFDQNIEWKVRLRTKIKFKKELQRYVKLNVRFSGLYVNYNKREQIRTEFSNWIFNNQLELRTELDERKISMKNISTNRIHACINRSFIT